MDILIFIVVGGLLLFLIGGFGLAMGGLFSSVLTGVYGWLSGSSSSSSYSYSYTIPEFSEDNSTPTQKPEGFLAASQRMSEIEQQKGSDPVFLSIVRKRKLTKQLEAKNPGMTYDELADLVDAEYQYRVSSGYYNAPPHLRH